MPDTIWKELKNFSKYLYSSKGDIKNKLTGQILKPTKNISGYLRISQINDENKLKTYLVHRLIAQAFYENPDNKKTVNHKNKNRSDNNIENLEWATHTEQMKHQRENTIRINNNNRGIWKCDKNTKVKLKFYKTIREASIDVTGDENKYKSISLCPLGKINTSYGYFWIYDDESNHHNEIWKLIIFIKDNTNYYVSDYGRIKNKKRILKLSPHHSGYVYCNIDGNQYSVHVLVAQTFIENENNKKIVNHIDSNKANNKLKNLEWVTQSENVIHAVKNGRSNITKVINYDINNNILGIYDSCSNAAQILKVNSRSVNKCCKKIIKSCGEQKLMFKYLEISDDLNNKKVVIQNNDLLNIPKINNKASLYKIDVLDRNNKLIETCATKKDASDKYKVNIKTVTQHCLELVKYSESEYRFKYSLELKKNIKTK